MANYIDIVFRAKDQFSSMMNTMSTNLGENSRKLRSIGRDIEQSGYNTMQAGKSLTKWVTVPVVGLATAIVKTGKEYESAMSGVQAVSQASATELEQMHEAIQSSVTGTTKSMKDGADVLQYTSLAGWSVQESMKGLPSILRLAEAGAIDTGRASDLATDSMSAMGLEVQDLERYLDVVAQTARSSNTDIDQMMEAYIGVGGVLRGLNVDFEESSVYLGMLANAGIKGSEAGTSLSAIMTNLTAPTGRAKKALDELGYSAFDAQGNFKGMDVVMGDLKEMISGMDEEQQTLFKSMIAGKNHLDGFNALLYGMDDNFDSLKDSVGQASGALEDMANTQTDNLEGDIASLRQVFEKLSTRIFKMESGALRDLIQRVRDFIQKINDMPDDKLSRIVDFFLKLITVGPLLLGVGKITKTIGDGILRLSKFAGKVKKYGSIFKVMFSGGNLVVLTLLAIVGAGILIYKNWDKIKAFIQNSTIGEKIEDVKEAAGRLKDAFSRVAEGAVEVWQKLEPVRAFFGEVLPIVFEIFVTTVLGYLESFIDFIAGWIEILLQGFSGIIDFLIGVFTGDWERAWEGIKTYIDSVVEFIKLLWQGAVDLLSKPIDAVVNALTKKFQDRMEGVKRTWEAVKKFLRNPIQGTVSLFRRGNLSGIDSNADGTNFFRGGLTSIHERGGEIIDLPRGSRIYPHDRSVQMAREEGNRGQNNNVHIAKIADTVVVREEQDIDKIASKTAKEMLKRMKNTGLNPSPA